MRLKPEVARPSYLITGGFAIAQDKEVRINGDITAPQVRLIGVDGEPLGIVTLDEAVAKADEANIDLVEIAPHAAPRYAA